MAEKINKTSVAYALGIVSIVFAFFSPFAGIILAIVGLTGSNKMKSKEAKRMNIVGLVLGIIMAIIYIVSVAYSINLPGA